MFTSFIRIRSNSITLDLLNEAHIDSRSTRRGIAAIKGIKATTDYTDFTDGKRREKRKLNLNSRTQGQINQPVSRQDASETNLKIFE